MYGPVDVLAMGREREAPGGVVVFEIVYYVLAGGFCMCLGWDRDWDWDG